MLVSGEVPIAFALSPVPILDCSNSALIFGWRLPKCRKRGLFIAEVQSGM